MEPLCEKIVHRVNDPLGRDLLNLGVLGVDIWKSNNIISHPTLMSPHEIRGMLTNKVLVRFV